MSLEPGSLIDDKYRVIRRIGEGGMGAVYHGENVRIRRQVAIKVLHAAVAQDAEVVQRFEREAQAAGCIGNDHILEVLDLGVLPSGDRYIVMEFLEGEPLSARIERMKRIAPAELSPILVQLLDGLSAAHQAGITHRDLKPDNIFLLKRKAGHVDFVKIIDFGISKFNKADGGIKMTRSGVVMGTPLYMSPEQARTAEADPRSDLYAVGVIMYEAVAGRVPFTADQFSQLLVQIVMGDYVPLHAAAPEIDPRFAAIVTKAMARERADRFQTAEEFRAVIEEWRVGAGLGRVSAVAPTMAMMGQTPVPGAGPAPWTTPYPAPPGLVATPNPHPQGQAGMTPYPQPQIGVAGMTPYPHPQPGSATPYPQPQPGAATPYPAPGGLQSGRVSGGPPGLGTPANAGGAPLQGSSHAWGASQSGAPGLRTQARAAGRTVPMILGGVAALGIAAAIAVPRFLPGRSASVAASAPPGDAPPRAAEAPPPPATAKPGAASAPVAPPQAIAPAPSASEAPVKLAQEPAPAPVPPAPVAAAPAAPSRAASRPASAAPKPAPEAKPPVPKNAPAKSSPDFGY
jgi:serine/threonine-protein kinase